MIKKLKGNLTAKIFLITASMLLLCSVCTYILIAFVMPITYYDRLDEEFQQKVLNLTHELEFSTPLQIKNIAEGFAKQNKTYVALLNENGIPINDMIFDYSVDERGGFFTMLGSLLRHPNEKQSTFLSIRFELDNSPEAYTLMTNYNPLEVNQAAAALDSLLPWILLAAVVIALLGSLLYMRYITKPIVNISRISKKLAELDFSWRCDEGRSDEIGILACSLNDLSTRLDKTLKELENANAALKDEIARERDIERKRQELFAAISHELKTPITVLKGQLDGMLHNIGIYKDREKYLARASEVTDTLESMVREILDISRMESSGFSANKERFDFSKLAAQQVKSLVPLAEQKNVQMRADIQNDLTISADEHLLKRAVGNLINNAISYTPSGETVVVEVYQKDNAIVFSVLNTGAHIPEQDLPHLLEAFYRVEHSRNRKTGGSGLGLYLVKTILEQHGSECVIQNTPSGVLATFHIEI